jgi:hypothetical protein
MKDVRAHSIIFEHPRFNRVWDKSTLVSQHSITFYFDRTTLKTQLFDESIHCRIQTMTIEQILAAAIIPTNKK